jgi:hypothetical protein
MSKRLAILALWTLTAAAVSVGVGGLTAGSAQQAQGQGVHLLGEGMPTLFTFDDGSMSCSVSWGTMGAPGPGPFSSPEMNLENVNFGMVVYSVDVSYFEVSGNRVTMRGKARSITSVNEGLVENEVYDFEVEAVDGGAAENDSFSMSLKGEGLMFDGHTFAPPAGSGLVSGDVAIGS